MYISSLKINKFRRFNNTNIKIGKRLTCISGQNGVGKSQILALLGNCGQLPTKMGSNIEGRAFKAEWSEIVTGDVNHDSIKSVKNALSISFEDVPKKSTYYKFPFVNNLSFRTGWQNDKVSLKEAKSLRKRVTSEEALAKIDSYIKNSKDNLCTVPKRFRIIPEKSKYRKTESKLEFPTYYLGLSRLYPVGEAHSVNVKKNNLTTAQIDYFKTNYQKIFDSYDEFNGLSSMSIPGNSKKHGLGIESKTYGPLGNSNGQDNLNQILAALVSFKELKNKMQDNFIGGLLLIDELDASLHPAAQNKLLDLLLEESRNTDIQIIFTTHSLSLIKHFQMMQENNQKKDSHDIEMTYITDGRGKIEVKQNPSNKWIQNELLTSTGKSTSQTNLQIPVITEDERANWLLQKVIDYFSQDNPELNSIKLQYLNFSTGWSNITNLIKYDYSYFSSFITILDADVPIDKLKKALYPSNYSIDDKNISKKSILLFPKMLPTKNPDNKFISDKDYRPYVELELWIFMLSLPEDHPFYHNKVIENIPFFKRNLLNEGPKAYSKGNTESKIKAWFNDNQKICNIAINYFIKNYESELKPFVNDVIEKYNSIIDSDYPQLTQIPTIQ